MSLLPMAYSLMVIARMQASGVFPMPEHPNATWKMIDETDLGTSDSHISCRELSPQPAPT